MNKEDFDAEIEMTFRQIVSLADLMLEQDNKESTNILTFFASFFIKNIILLGD